MIQNLERGELHHAYLLVGDREEIRMELTEFLGRVVGPDFSSNPDVWWREYTSFGIDDSHELRGFQTLRAVRGEHKFIIVSLSQATIEAQNALLKTIEEPTQSVHVFLIIESLDRVVSTIVSRCQLLKQERSVDGAGSNLDQARAFALSEPIDRLKQITSLLEIEETKDMKAEAVQFINKLEAHWHKQKDNLTDWREGLDRLEKTRAELSWPTASVKSLLEHLAVSLPILK
ncbi:MAG: hypothetical protein WCO03_02025 [bacterium]